MNKKFIKLTSLLLTSTLFLTGCINEVDNKKTQEKENQIEETVIEETTTIEETVEEEKEIIIQEELNKPATEGEGPIELPMPELDATSKNVIRPLESTLDINNLNDCTLHASITKESLIEKEGEQYLTFKVFDYDLYDLVDISTLEEGSIIELRDEEIEVEQLEKLDTGLIFINGGLEMGGYDLYTNENGVYFETLMNDYKVFRNLGEVEFKISPNFVFTDNMDLDNMGKTYSLEDLFKENSEIDFFFNEFNTTIVIENNEVIELIRNYIP